MNTATADSYLFAPPAVSAIPVVEESRFYPVHRIFCVGRNYAEHAKEMGVEVDREAPFYFTKSPGTVVASGASVPYPPGTANYHYEMELVVAIGAPAFRVGIESTQAAIFGYACGLDMTRRDLQLAARAKGRPWDTGKDFEESAVVAAIVPAARVGELDARTLRLEVDGSIRQETKLAELVWSVPELIADLSKYYHLAAGDLIFTGTPAGVGAVTAGSRLVGTIDGLPPVELRVGEAET